MTHVSNVKSDIMGCLGTLFLQSNKIIKKKRKNWTINFTFIEKKIGTVIFCLLFYPIYVKNGKVDGYTKIYEKV